MVPQNILNRLWSLAFIASFVITAISIGFIRVSSQDVMMSADELNWYYLLYLFGSMSVVLGVINLWMYRRSVVKILFSQEDEEYEKDENKN